MPNPTTSRICPRPDHNDLATRLFAELEGARRTGRWSVRPRIRTDCRTLADELKDFWDADWPNSAVVYCLHSENPPEPHQRRTVEALGAHWIEMDAGHYPMLTHGEELARHILG